MVDGAPPAPPPTTIEFAANVPELAQVADPEKYGTPPEVPETDRAKVPLVVTGEPLTEIKPPVKVCETEVTEPEAPALDAIS
jgi:hypothetical protein